MTSLYSDTFITRYGKEPTPQADRTLTLVMLGKDSLRWEHELFVKPEEITYTYPTRATVIQTLGGAFVDDFGEGITDMVINGHTGWHYAPDINGDLDSLDGLSKMHDLRYYFFQVYHEERMAAAQQGEDPDTAISLYFFDTLHETAYRVYPLSLQVRKHKSRPLLYQYQMRLIGLEKVIGDADSIDWTDFLDGLDGLDGNPDLNIDWPNLNIDWPNLNLDGLGWNFWELLA